MTNEMMVQQVRELKSLKIMAKELAEEIAKIETSLKAEMEAQGKEHMVVDVFKLNYITVTTNRIDTTALKKELPHRRNIRRPMNQINIAGTQSQ